MAAGRDSLLAIDDILEAIGNIESDTEGLDFARFAADRRTRQLVERNIEIISEASRRLSDDVKAAEPGIPWRDIAGIGNILRRDYGADRPEVRWDVRPYRPADLREALIRLRRATLN